MMFGTREARILDGVNYAPGRKFRVVKAGLTLSGWVPERGCSGGWSQKLNPGDVIECTGFGVGMGGDPGYGVEWTSDQAKVANAFHVDTWPMTGGAFAYRPPVGYLVPVDDEDGE